MSIQKIINEFVWSSVKSFQYQSVFEFLIKFSSESDDGGYLEINCKCHRKKELEEEEEDIQIESVLVETDQNDQERIFSKTLTYLDKSRNRREFLSIAEPYKWSYFRYNGNELIRNIKTRKIASSIETLIAFSVGLGRDYQVESKCFHIYSGLSEYCKFVVLIFPHIQIAFQYSKKEKSKREVEEEELFEEEIVISRNSRKRKILKKDKSTLYPHKISVVDISMKKKMMRDEDDEEEEEEEEEEEQNLETLQFYNEKYNDNIAISCVINSHLIKHLNEVEVTNRCRILVLSENNGLITSRNDLSQYLSEECRKKMLKTSFFKSCPFFKKVNHISERNDGVLYSINISCEFELSQISSCCIFIRFLNTSYSSSANIILQPSDILRSCLLKMNESLISEKKDLEKKEEVERCVDWISSSLADIVRISENSAFKENCLKILGVANIGEMKNSLDILVRNKVEEGQEKKRKKKKKKKK